MRILPPTSYEIINPNKALGRGLARYFVQGNKVDTRRAHSHEPLESPQCVCMCVSFTNDVWRQRVCDSDAAITRSIETSLDDTDLDHHSISSPKSSRPRATATAIHTDDLSVRTTTTTAVPLVLANDGPHEIISYVRSYRCTGRQRQSLSLCGNLVRFSHISSPEEAHLRSTLLSVNC